MKNKIFKKSWWYKALARGIRSFWQSYVVLLPTEMMTQDINYKFIFVVSFAQMMLSISTSLISLPEYEQEKEEIEILEDEDV